MSDEPRRPPHDTVERRRDVGHVDEVRGKLIDPRRVTATANPNAPVTRAELEAFESRVLEQVDAKLDGYAGGLENRVRDAVRFQVESSISPYKPGLAKLDQIADDAAELRKAAEDTRVYRKERELHDANEKRDREKREAELKEALSQAQRELLDAQTKNIPVEAGIKYRTALLGVVIAAIGLIGVLGGAAIHSLAGH